MSAKQIDVTCPCCSSRLTIDVLTARVMRTEQAAQPGKEGERGDKWASAHERVQDRTRSGQDKFESGLERERTKSSRFDEMFRKAQEKHARGEDDEDVRPS